MEEDPDFNTYDPAQSKGITTPREEYFSVENVAFHNFKNAEQSAIYTCSQCDEGEDRDSARTTWVKGLVFDEDTDDKRLKFNSPFRDIVVDVDGSLTQVEGEELKPMQTVVRFGKHFD